MDLNSVNIEDIPMTKEAIRQLISLGREEMPNAMGIDRFAYHLEATAEGGEAEKEHEDAENPLPAQDPPSIALGSVIIVYPLCTILYFSENNEMVYFVLHFSQYLFN
jgi:hypothetical protein